MPPRQEVAALVAPTTPSFDEKDARVSFLDDGRPLDRGAGRHLVATPNRDIPPTAGKPDLTLADWLTAVARIRRLGCGLGQAAYCRGTQRHDLDGRTRIRIR